MPNPQNYLDKQSWEDLTSIDDILLFLEDKLEGTDLKKQELLESNYPPGGKFQGQIVSLQKYGIFVEFGLDAQRGFLPVKDLISFYDETYIESNFEIGQTIDFEIVKYSQEHQKFNIKII